MRIAYCTNVRLPSERAHGHQIAQVCDALASLGHTVQIFAPFRENVVQEEYWTYYGADRSVGVTYLGSFDAIKSRLLPGVLGLLTMNIMMRIFLRQALRAERFDLLYTRTPALLPTLLASRMSVLLELHQLPRWGKGRFARQCNRCIRVVCLTSEIYAALCRLGVGEGRLTVEGDGVDLHRFEHLPSKEGARSIFRITTSRMVVGYIGRLKTLKMEKGVGIFLKALAALREERVFFGFIVGGPEGDRREYEGRAHELGLSSEDLLFTGELPPSKVPTALAACDAFVMPFPDVPHYRTNMSPLKMFEYMAASRPIVTSDLPTVRDVLSEDSAIFCNPGDIASLKASLQWVRSHPKEAEARAVKARALVQEHTWEKRMARILTHL